MPTPWTTELQKHQRDDPVVIQLRQALDKELHSSRAQWRQPSLRRYRQLWSQLSIVDNLVCRTYCPGPTKATVTVPVIPASLTTSLLQQVHDSPGAGHLGIEKTMERARRQGYWVNMFHDVTQYCLNCSKCQAAKLPMPTRAPLEPVPIGRPWQMIAVGILEVPTSYQQNRYLLVIQDYFTKWAEAVPLPDQTAERISKELVKVFTTFGMPEFLHSDQGRNFESSVLRQVLTAFGINKTHTTAYHPQGDGMVERLNRSLLQMLRTYVTDRADWESLLPLMLFAYRTAVHSSTGATPFELMFGR